MKPLISVIIPAFNAADTIAETLESALAQTVREIELVVVDDGSTDATAQIVRGYRSMDARIKLISTDNAGVAAARNTAIANAGGDFIAPLDADDLWRPEKLALQMARFEQGPPAVGLVYNWYRRIDDQGRSIGQAATPVVEGWVLHRHLEWNFVSNGSTPLIRKPLLRGLEYSTQLQSAGNQGCEDYLLQLQLAKRCQFSCVQAFLTGYRRTAGAMSTDAGRMIRSHIQMFATIRPAVGPAAQRRCDARTAAFYMEYVRNRARRRLWREAAGALGRGMRADPISALTHAGRQGRDTIGYLTRKLTGTYLDPTEISGERAFLGLDPYFAEGDWRPDLSPSRLSKLISDDEAYGREHGGDQYQA